MNFKIHKTEIQAKTHQLSAQWTFGSTTCRIKPLSLEQLTSLWWLSNNGTCVPIYDPEQIDSAIAWCKVNTTTFAESNTRYPMSDDDYRLEINRRALCGDWAGEYAYESENASSDDVDLETRISDLLAHEIRQEIDNDILRALGVPTDFKKHKSPSHYFFFSDSTQALLFKLTWGGE